MLFVSHKLNTNTCGFCNQEFLKDKVDVFGYSSINDKAAICSNCLQDIIKNAINNKSKTSNNADLSHCDFCSQSVPDVIRVFSNGKLGICEECISSFISTSLWIGKTQGVELFNQKNVMLEEKQMDKENLQKIAKQTLSNILNESGSILYSSHKTLKPNDIYLLGFNPGGKDGAPLSKSIDKMLQNTENAYLDECWENGNGTWGKGEALLQKRVQWILEELGFNPRNVCASNLIFIQSKKAEDINYSLAKQCWPVHEAIIKIVKPKILLAFGNSDVSPYGYLKSMLGGTEDSICSGHGNWRVKEFSAIINNKKVIIVGLPHLSRYEPRGKDKVIDWLKSKAQI